MHLNTDPLLPARKPCLRDLHRLTTMLLPPALVARVPLEELARRAQEINATHPQYQQEMPLVLAWEMSRRQRMRGQLVVTANHCQVA
jgi:hypothetical protein